MPHPKSGYRTKDGKRVPGVTTIIGRFKDSGGLLWWAFEQGKSAERGEINSLYDKRDEAADAGTLAHEMVENYLNGKTSEPIDMDNSTQVQALQGFQNFLQWFQNNKIEIIEQEMQLVSEEYKFGGTPDAIGLDSNNNLVLLDWKTSNHVYPDYITQLAAYNQLIEENYHKKLTGGFHLLRFSKEHADFAHHYWSELNDAWKQFLLFREAYDIDKKLKRRV